jgi:hypothetical protein
MNHVKQKYNQNIYYLNVQLFEYPIIFDYIPVYKYIPKLFYIQTNINYNSIKRIPKSFYNLYFQVVQ